MYLAYSTRPDIVFAVKKLSKYNINPQKSHLWVTEKVMCYLNRMMQLRLVYNKQSDESSNSDLLLYKLIRYNNYKFAGDTKDKKLVMRHWFFLNKVIVL